MKKQRMYISGPITGTEDYMKRFRVMEERLTSMGVTVINPAAVNYGLPECTTHEEYMKMSLTMLGMCDAIMMMEGFENSVGCNIELEYAIEHRIPVMFEEAKKV